jgi:hypothetical protein
MKIQQNSFINYINQQNNLFRISNIRNYRLTCKIINLKSNLYSIDFGHFSNFKITSMELQKYFGYNRLLSVLKNKKDLLNNKLNCEFIKISPKGNPIFKNLNSKIEKKDLNNKIKSLLLLKRAFINKNVVNARIVKKVSKGFLVVILGFFAFLPNSQYFLISKKRRARSDVKKKIFYNVIPVVPLTMKYVLVKPKRLSKIDFNYELNIVVSFRKGIKKFEELNRKYNLKKLIRISRITKLKNLNKPNKNKLKQSYIL